MGENRDIRFNNSRCFGKPQVTGILSDGVQSRKRPVCGEFQLMQQWVSEIDLCNEIATNNF